MRKTQVALAAMALVASTAVLADGVKVYGTVDAGVISTSGGTAMYGAGNNGTTSFGLSGSTDAGNGVKTGFNLEAGLNARTGATDNGGVVGGSGLNNSVGSAIFNRAANVFVGNENATVTLGTQISPFITGILTGANSVGGNGVFVPALYIATANKLGYVGQGTSTLSQSTGGFFIPEAASLSISGGGVNVNLLSRVAVSDSNNSTYSAANLNTTAGGINFAVSYENVGASTSVGNTTNTNVAQSTSYALSANTEISGVRMFITSANTKSGTSTYNGYFLGASMPLTERLSAGISQAGNSKLAQGSLTSLSLQYALSPNSQVYATYNSFSKSNAVMANDSAGRSGTDAIIVGATHNF